MGPKKKEVKKVSACVKERNGERKRESMRVDRERQTERQIENGRERQRITIIV